MGVIKTASESILEETVVPSEEANYSLQGHTGKKADNFIYFFMHRKKSGNVAKDKCAPCYQVS